MSETVKIRGRVSGVRIAPPSATRHALPELSADPPPRTARTTSAPAPTPPPPDLDTLLDEAFQQGRAAGRREAEQDAAAGLQEKIDEERARCQALAASLTDQLAALADRLEREAFQFALAVAGRILKREVTLDDQAVLGQIHDAVRRVSGVESVRVRVNPRDEALVRQERPLLMTSSESVRELIIETDDKIEPGGCMLETGSGTVDARFSTQLEQIEAALFGQVVS